jgi:hypothetical protein
MYEGGVGGTGAQPRGVEVLRTEQTTVMRFKPKPKEPAR